MNTGRLDQKITIRLKHVTRNARGGEDITWVDDVTIWAAAEPVRGSQYVALAQAESDLNVKFTINFRTGISVDSRVVWRDTTYEIISPPIDPYGRKQYLELMCRTSQNA